MRGIRGLTLLASAAALAVACGKKAEEATSEASATAEEAASGEAAPEVLAETGVAAPIGSANVVIGLQNGAPYFSQASEGFCQNGGCQSGIVMDSGDIDLSGFPPGDVTITVTIDSAASGAGYRFASDPYQAVAIAEQQLGGPPATPVFGSWPSDFDPPSVSSDGLTLTFVDEEEDTDLYEYSIGLNGPSGRVVMDPKIQNGGSGTGNK